VLSREASLLLDRGELDAASEKIDDAASVFKATGGPDHPDFTNVHFVRGRIAMERGELATAVAELRSGQVLAQADSGGSAIDQIEWPLARALALQGDAQGRVLAESVVGRLSEKLGRDDWRVRLKLASLTLPPFATAADAEDLEDARALIDELARSFPPEAPRIKSLAAQLAAAR
jgi:hypothetical protein